MTQSASAARANFSWRNIDIIIAAVIGVAVGLIFVIWNIIGGAGYEAVNALTPGLGGVVAGMWFLGGPLGAYIIRKPGAAIFVEVIAATVSALIGNQWGITTLYSGLAQGLGAELVFLILAYKSYNLATVVISGLMAGVGAWTYELFHRQPGQDFRIQRHLPDLHGAVWCRPRRSAGLLPS